MSTKETNREFLRRDIISLKGVGASKKKALNQAGIYTNEDLLYCMPKNYQDRREVNKIFKVKPEQPCLIQGRVVNKVYKGYGKKKAGYGKGGLLRLDVVDESGMMRVVFFNGYYISKMLIEGEEYSFYGTVTENGFMRQMVHPDFHRVGEAGDQRGLVAVYGTIGGIGSKGIARTMRQLKPGINGLIEWMPSWIVEKYKLADPAYAFKGIHFPLDKNRILQGRYRLIFEELFIMEIGLLYMKGGIENKALAPVIPRAGVEEFIEDLPFKLTDDQIQAVDDILTDLSTNKPMNRLVQGDVGSGKTVVAECAMFCAAKAGFQSTMMVPTEILAKQHFEQISTEFSRHGINVGLLISNQSAAERRSILEDIRDGKLDVIIGTHAVISDGVEFKKLGLVITDEQHRFGVNQRNLLSEKGENPNVLVMTATPIPRTIAVIIFGDLDISVIKAMPEGRKPIRTTIARDEIERTEVYNLVEEQLKSGRQGYVVTPLISESDAIEAKSVEEVFSELEQRFTNYSVAMVHGAMKKEEKDAVMSAFYRGDIKLLVSTVVIEVGVNVPNATVMVIENCERFGLAQLHQLRGRVGRGNNQSYCCLVMNKATEDGLKRARIMEATVDGFEIAEADLNMRGPGDILGTRQHGLPNLRMAHLTKHMDVLEKAIEAAKILLTKDPELKKDENKEIRQKVEDMYGDNGYLTL